MPRQQISMVKSRLVSKIGQVQLKLKDFRYYDLASYAINGLTSRKGYYFHKNIAYGLKARQRLDLFRSKSPHQKRPLIVFVYGGAWSHGDKKAYKFVGEAFAKEGFDVAVINYHLAPEHIFPSYVDDLTLAINFLSQQKQKLEISSDNIVLMGHSAGAFNLMSALYHPSPYEKTDLDNIKAVVGIAGPYHFDYKGDPLAQDAFDQSVPFQQVMPYYFVKSNQIRHYLLTAENDKIVRDSNSIDMQNMLKQHGNHCEIRTIPKTGHVTIMGSIFSLFSPFFSTKSQILQCLDETFN